MTDLAHAVMGGALSFVITVFAVCAVILTAAIILLGVALRLGYTERRFRNTGIKTRATVVGYTRRNLRRAIIVTFPVGEEDVTKPVNCRYGIGVHNTPVGSAVDIKYYRKSIFGKTGYNARICEKGLRSHGKSIVIGGIYAAVAVLTAMILIPLIRILTASAF
jgi:hypothetical protein